MRPRVHTYLLVLVPIIIAWKLFVTPSIPEGQEGYHSREIEPFPPGYTGIWKHHSFNKERTLSELIELENGKINGRYCRYDAVGFPFVVEEYASGIPSNRWVTYHNGKSYILEFSPEGKPLNGKYPAYDMNSMQLVFVDYNEGKVIRVTVNPSNSYLVHSDGTKTLMSKTFTPTEAFIVLTHQQSQDKKSIRRNGYRSYPVIVYSSDNSSGTYTYETINFLDDSESEEKKDKQPEAGDKQTGDSSTPAAPGS